MKRLPTLILSLLGAAASAWAVPIDYTFDLDSPAGPASTLLVSSNEDASVQIQLSALAGLVQIDAAGAGYLSGVGDTLDIEGGESLLITPVSSTFVGPYTLVSTVFGNVDTGPGNSGDEAVVSVDGGAGITVTLPAPPAAYTPGAVFNASVAFGNSDGNDDFRIAQIVINGDTGAAAVPEPSAVSMMGLGLLALAVLGRRYRGR